MLWPAFGHKRSGYRPQIFGSDSQTPQVYPTFWCPLERHHRDCRRGLDCMRTGATRTITRTRQSDADHKNAAITSLKANPDTCSSWSQARLPWHQLALYSANQSAPCPSPDWAVAKICPWRLDISLIPFPSRWACKLHDDPCVLERSP